jgi:hypothetical protein
MASPDHRHIWQTIEDSQQSIRRNVREIKRRAEESRRLTSQSFELLASQRGARGFQIGP